MMLIEMTSLPVADCSTFLPLRWVKLNRQWFEVQSTDDAHWQRIRFTLTCM